MLRCRTLGALELTDPTGRAHTAVLAQPKRVALLVYLAVANPGGFHRRDSLLALFWPELDDEHARAALRQALTFLRHELGDEVIRTRGAEEVGVEPSAWDADVVTLHDALREGELERVLELYRGEFLPGFHIPGADEFGRWLEEQRHGLRHIAAEAAWRLMDQAEAIGSRPEAVRWARRVLELQPDNEQALRKLLWSLAQAGDRATALREYDAFTHRLVAEYQSEPSPETRTLMADIRARRDVPPVQVTHSPPETSAGNPAAAGTAEISNPLRARDFLARPGLRRGLLGAALVVVAGMGVWIRFAHGHAPVAPPSPDRVAVFPFTVQAGPEQVHLGEAVMDLLGSAVDGVGDLRRVDPAAIVGQLQRDSIHLVDPRAGVRLAREVGAGRFVVGTVTWVASQVRISASLYEVAQGLEPVGRSARQGPEETIAGLVEQVATDLLASISLGPGGRLERVATVHAANYRALKAYLEAERYLRLAQEDSAKVLLIQAVTLDSTFALAWYRLVFAQGFTLDWRQGESADRAYRFRDRLSPRDQMLAAVIRARMHGDDAQAESLALATVGRYPDEVEAWWDLGVARLWGHWKWGRSPLEGLTPLERAVQLDPGHRYALYNAIWLRLYQRDYARADSLAAQAHAHRVESPFWLTRRALIRVFREDDQPGQDSLLEALSAKGDMNVARWGVGVARYSDRLDGGRRVLQLLLDPARRAPETQGLAHTLLAWVDLAGGQWGDGQREFTLGAEREPGLAHVYRAFFAAAPFFQLSPPEVLALRDSLDHWQVNSPRWQARPEDPDTWRYGQPPELRGQFLSYLRGLLSARAGDATDAERQARRLEQARGPGDSAGLLPDLAREVRALAALEAGRPERALAILEQMTMRTSWHYQQYASPFYLRPLARYLRGEALYRLGRFQEALGWYWFGVLGHPECVFQSPAYLRSGEIYEKLGDRANALEYYGRFVARWRDADERYQPLVRDVRARIARLSARK